MPEGWIPLDRRPITVPPTQQDVEVARDVCFKTLDKMFGMFWHSGIVADAWDTREADPEKRKALVMTLPFWATVTTDEFTEIQKLNDEADERVRRWALFFDRFAADVMNVGRSSYSNAPMGILGMVGEFIGRASEARAALVEIDRKPPSDEIADGLARIARQIWDAGIAVVGADFHGAYSRIQARLRVETAKAWDAAEKPATAPPVLPEPTLSDEERWIIDALRKAGKRMTQLKLLDAAGLGQHGTTKALLSQMRQRGLIDNNRDDRGNGYGLPEWK
jgi:hypothetical protein